MRNTLKALEIPAVKKSVDVHQVQAFLGILRGLVSGPPPPTPNTTVHGWSSPLCKLVGSQLPHSRMCDPPILRADCFPNLFDLRPPSPTHTPFNFLSAFIYFILWLPSALKNPSDSLQKTALQRAVTAFDMKDCNLSGLKYLIWVVSTCSSILSPWKWWKERERLRTRKWGHF